MTNGLSTVFASRLWRHRRLRDAALQTLALIGLFAVCAWLAGNVAANYGELDKRFGFGFLWQLPAGYDINQTLIDYSSRDTHLRAALVGVLNTGLVAAVAIVLATATGFFVGAVRLSGSWLAARLAAVYVECARNTPLLLLILLFHGIIINTLPHPRAALAVVEGSVFLTNRGFFLPRPETGPGFWLFAATAVAGLILTVAVRRRRKSARRRGIDGITATAAAISIAAAAIVYAAAGSPVTFDPPVLRGFNFRGGVTLLPEFVALAGALAFYTSGFIAEIVRGGILSVDKGQTEASRALGLGEYRTLRHVVLPQALRAIVPPLTSEYLALIKNSSLAIAIGYMDLVATLGGITLTQTGREMEAMILVMLIYLLISLAVAAFMNWYNRRIGLIDR